MAGDENDKVIIAQILDGDINKYKLLVQKYQRQVYHVILKITGNVDDATELTQEVFIKAYNSLSGYNHDYKFFSWLYRIAINEALLLEKKNKKFDRFETIEYETIEKQDYEVDQEHKSKLLNEAINSLQDKYKQVITLKYYAKLSYSEIAETTNVPEKKVKSRLFEARKILKENLTKMNFFEQIQYN